MGIDNEINNKGGLTAICPHAVKKNMRKISKLEVRIISKRVLCFAMAMMLLFGFAVNSFAATKKSKSIQCNKTYGGGYGSEIKLTCKSNETVKVYFTCERGKMTLKNALYPDFGKAVYSFNVYGAYEIKIIDNTTKKNVIPPKFFNNGNKNAFNVYSTSKSKEISFSGVKGRTYTIKAWFWNASTTAKKYSFSVNNQVNSYLDRQSAFWTNLPNIFANVTASKATLNTIK